MWNQIFHFSWYCFFTVDSVFLCKRKFCSKTWSVLYGLHYIDSGKDCASLWKMVRICWWKFCSCILCLQKQSSRKMVKCYYCMSSSCRSRYLWLLLSQFYLFEKFAICSVICTLHTFLLLNLEIIHREYLVMFHRQEDEEHTSWFEAHLAFVPVMVKIPLWVLWIIINKSESCHVSVVAVCRLHMSASAS